MKYGMQPSERAGPPLLDVRGVHGGLRQMLRFLDNQHKEKPCPSQMVNRLRQLMHTA